ncbi:MAG: 6-phosphogluconate dehydrogenase [Cyclobacteriaceae bacterium]|nr:6-phosphogluconate dehydrogenase [Cyclobacteriaceae bacterium]
MENESFGQRVKRKTTSALKKILLVVVILGVAIFAFLYFVTFEKGVLAGKVLRISEKGVLFKTYEGKLNLDTFGALKGTSPIAESFDFSVEGHQDTIIKTLEEVALSGERVNLHFKKHYMTFPWRGDTKYFVTEVERVK